MKLEPHRFDYLLGDIEALTKPNYHKLNAKGDRLLHACLCAYAKHHLDNSDIGWDQLGNILHSAICEAIGDDEYRKWTNRISP
jgi:hypothetical protein